MAVLQTQSFIRSAHSVWNWQSGGALTGPQTVPDREDGVSLWGTRNKTKGKLFENEICILVGGWT